MLTLAAPILAVWLGLAVWQAALAYAGIALILWALVRAHARVVIERFDDYTTPPGQPTDASASNGREGKTHVPKDPGAAVLLANKLAELRELYGFVDDPDKTPAPGHAARATVQLDDASGVLRSAVTTESTVSLGPITLPWGALMGVVARFSQAPQLRGAIHGDERALILTAELTRHRQPYSWRVEGEVEHGASPRQQLESMVLDDLAYQVFSDLTLQRQARWPATKYWLIALGKMAECQRRPRNRRLLLKEAEENFLKALAEDERFYLACLNLGIVYRRLALELERQPYPANDSAKADERHGARRYRSAARRVFAQAIDLRPERWEAYHALADVHWTPHDPSGSLEMIPGLCDRALDRGPDRAARARILDLKAHAEERAAKLARDEEQRTDEADVLMRAAVDSRRRASQCALKELRRARTRRRDPNEARRIETLEKQASQCLVNLAATAWEARALDKPKERDKAKRDDAAFRWVHSITRFAAKLSDLDAEAHAVLARMATNADRAETAEAELSAAARIAPGNALYAAGLAHALAPAGGRRALDACERAERLIDFGLEADAAAAEQLVGAYETLAPALDEASSRLPAIRGRMRLPEELERALSQDDPIVALKKMLKHWDKKRDWERARIQEALGTEISRSDPEKVGEAEQRGQDADTHLKAALDWFLRRQPTHRRVAELHAKRAQALALVPASSGEALAQAETAVKLDPLSARYRDVLATAYESGGDLDSAVRVAEVAVLLEPDVPRRHYRKAKLRWALAESLADPAVHDEQRRRASAEFEHALTLYESDQQSERRATSWWLARSYFAMSEFSLVPPHLRFVLGSLTEAGTSEGEQLVRAAAEMWLAMTYRKLQDFYAAERHARRAIDIATALDDVTDKGLKLIFPSEMDDEDWPLGLVLVLAHVQLASSRADRGAKLTEANKSLAAARAVLARMKKMDDLSDPYREALSDYHAAHGRVLMARGHRTDAAIDVLQKAVDLDPGEADVYLLLARAHARATQERVEQEWHQHIRAARDACRRVREIGGEAHPDAIATAEIEQELSRIEETVQADRDLVEAPGSPAEVAGKPPTDSTTESPQLMHTIDQQQQQQQQQQQSPPTRASRGRKDRPSRTPANKKGKPGPRDQAESEKRQT